MYYMATLILCTETPAKLNAATLWAAILNRKIFKHQARVMLPENVIVYSTRCSAKIRTHVRLPCQLCSPSTTNVKTKDANLLTAFSIRNMKTLITNETAAALVVEILQPLKS